MGQRPTTLPNHTDAANAVDGVEVVDGGGGNLAVDVQHGVGVVALGLVDHIFNVQSRLAQHGGDLRDDVGHVCVEYTHTGIARNGHRHVGI